MSQGISVSKNFKGKNIWIIGASSGIGHALAMELAGQGATLVLSARREEELTKLAGDLEGQNHLPLPVDVADPKTLKDALSHIQENLGQLDSVIFLAAIYSPHDEQRKELEFIHKMLEVNIGGAFNLIDAVMPYYEEKGQGQLVICASVAGFRGLPKGQPYCATKAALISLCETMRIENANTGIDVKVINPGFVKTPLTDKNDFPMPMIIEAEDAAKAITRDLLTNKFEIHFPKKFTFIMKILRIMPTPLYVLLAKKMI